MFRVVVAFVLLMLTALPVALAQDECAPRSHGCVNLSLTDAYWLYGYLSDAIDQQAESPVWPAVYVYGGAV